MGKTKTIYQSFVVFSAEAQKQIEDVRAACREYLVAQDKDLNQSWMSPTANGVASVPSGDDGLETFHSLGAQAVMVSDLELCGGQCLRGANCSNRGSSRRHHLPALRESLEEGPLDRRDRNRIFEHRLGEKNIFTALVLSVFGGNKDCPTRDIPLGEGKESYVFPAWKQSCAAVVKWNGTKFTYKPL